MRDEFCKKQRVGGGAENSRVLRVYPSLSREFSTRQEVLSQLIQSIKACPFSFATKTFGREEKQRRDSPNIKV
jgi:hypothetical protein